MTAKPIRNLRSLTGLEVVGVVIDEDLGYGLELSDGRVIVLGHRSRVRRSGRLARTLGDAGGTATISDRRARYVADNLAKAVCG